MKGGPLGLELKILQNELQPLCNFEILGFVISFKLGIGINYRDHENTLF